MPSTLSACAVMIAQGGVHGLAHIRAAPVAGQRRIEHVAQPMQDHRLARLAQDPVVHPLVIGGAARNARERPARHHDELAAELLDRCHLLLVAGDDLVDGLDVLDHQMIGAAARCDQGARQVARRVERAADQLQRGRPVQAHAALRRVHGLGHAQAQRPQVAAVGDRCIPVDRALQPGVDGCKRVGHDMRGGVGDAVETRSRRGAHGRRATQGVGREPAVKRGQLQLERHGGAFKSAAASRPPSAGPSSFPEPPRPVARPWRLPPASSDRARSAPRDG